MRLNVLELRSLIREAIKEREKNSHASILGVKNKDVRVNAGSKIAKKIEPDLTDLIHQSYAAIGGNPKIQDVGDLSSEYPEWVVADVDDDPEVDDLLAGRQTPAGTKLAVAATDGSQKAKSYLPGMMKRAYSQGWWGEVSGAMASLSLKKLNIPCVNDEKQVRQLLGNKEITWFGDHPEGKFPGTHGWYSRDIGGKQVVKIIVGNI